MFTHVLQKIATTHMVPVLLLLFEFVRSVKINFLTVYTTDVFSKKNINEIPVESTPHASGSRRLIVNKDDINSKYFEACTYGYLPAGEKWSMHNHDNIDEICIVVKGSGIIRDEKGATESFLPDDRFIFPANTNHEIENTSEDADEFYFFRLQDK